jgi:hypothetical protein
MTSGSPGHDGLAVSERNSVSSAVPQGGVYSPSPEQFEKAICNVACKGYPPKPVLNNPPELARFCRSLRSKACISEVAPKWVVRLWPKRRIGPKTRNFSISARGTSSLTRSSRRLASLQRHERCAFEEAGATGDRGSLFSLADKPWTGGHRVAAPRKATAPVLPLPRSTLATMPLS